MKSRLLMTAAALALATSFATSLATPAAAQGGRGHGWHGGHHHHHGGWGRGWGPGIGFGVGVGIGAGLANSYAYQPGYGGYYVDDDPDEVAIEDNSQSDAYCSQKYRSYDPRSGTYLGYDGQRHPCP